MPRTFIHGFQIYNPFNQVGKLWVIVWLACQDFANQVYWSRQYSQACSLAKVAKGVYATPEVAEYMAGAGWNQLGTLTMKS